MARAGCNRRYARAPGNLSETSSMRAGDRDRRRHQYSRLRSSKRLAVAPNRQNRGARPCRKTSSLGYPLAMRSRVFRHRYPPPDLHAANPACGSARPGNRMARIAQPGVAVGVGWILGTSCQDSEIVSHCRTSGTRCPDSRPLYASQRRPSVDGGSRLQSISRARDRKSPRVLSLPARLWKNSLLDHPRPVDDDVQRGLLLLSFRHDLLSPIGDDEALSVVDQGSRHPRG